MPNAGSLLQLGSPPQVARKIRKAAYACKIQAERLAAANVPLFAITNFPAQMYPVARQRFPFLRLFRDVAVSGYERLVKPDPALFHILLRRNDIAPSRAVFIDDTLRNVEAANALDLHGIHFTSPEALERELRALGLLTEQGQAPSSGCA